MIKWEIKETQSFIRFFKDGIMCFKICKYDIPKEFNPYYYARLIENAEELLEEKSDYYDDYVSVKEYNAKWKSGDEAKEYWLNFVNYIKNGSPKTCTLKIPEDIMEKLKLEQYVIKD